MINILGGIGWLDTGFFLRLNYWQVLRVFFSDCRKIAENTLTDTKKA